MRIKIDINNYKFKERGDVYNVMIYNTGEFIKLLLDICKEACPSLPNDCVYDITKICCNEETRAWFLKMKVNVFIWYFYAPLKNNNLEDWVFEVDEKNIVREMQK